MTGQPGPIGPQTRTQKGRSEATRAALVAAARTCFGQTGYHATSTADLVAAASVTRGALYHHFADKEALFAVLARQVAQAISDDAIKAVRGAEGSPWHRLKQGLEVYLGMVAANGEVQRILLLDGPAVLGWQGWRTIQAEVVLPGIIHGLRLAMDDGTIGEQDTGPLAHLMLAALNDAALMIAHAEAPEPARLSVTTALMSVIGGLAIAR